MKIDLSGWWSLRLEPECAAEPQHGEIRIPGILQAQGFGEDISLDTPWVSGLHDPLWYQRKEYAFGAENPDGVKVPFLAQPPKHYIGKAWYERSVAVTEECETWTLFIELTRWRSQVWVDGVYQGEDVSLCAAHQIPIHGMKPGIHRITVCIDNSFQYPYRPDGHGVSDALGGTWNGMAGEVALLDEEELEKRSAARLEYAKQHPRNIKVQDGRFWVDGRPEYFRGTHFGGDYPLTGCPSVELDWWRQMMKKVKEWGLNFIRFHSNCPPEAAFAAADEAGVYLQPECGMWNVFSEGIPMLEVLRRETRKILEQFGHHPSFVLFSPTNEPGGSWYGPLKQWVKETRAYDEELGYGGRRVYTAQSGWFYDTEPGKITGTDYLYFHRSAYGPYLGGNIRNSEGWKGKDYAPSLEGASLPVICHELGQWCAYPDFSVIERFTGYLRPGNYEIFRETARKHGLLEKNKELAFCSGKNQVMMYKEDLEADFRTPGLYGFELLDLHDYLGQGTALVGVLDPFWQEKGYVTPQEWKQFCSPLVLLARIPSYVVTSREVMDISLEVCYFGRKKGEIEPVFWSLLEDGREMQTGQTQVDLSAPGKNLDAGSIRLDFRRWKKNTSLVLSVRCRDAENHWDFHVYADPVLKSGRAENPKHPVLYTRTWTEALRGLSKGEAVVYSPYQSALGYQCPPLALKPVFWNAQMGPSWGRTVGLCCEKEHPVFADFPTERWGGWQWEDILNQARGMDMSGFPEELCSMVRPIDDWNRGLPLSMMFECRVGEGRLLVVSACLEGSFSERPAAYSLKQSICRYAASEAFCPTVQVAAEQIENLLFPDFWMREKQPEIRTEGTGGPVSALLDGNPDNAFFIEAEHYPMAVEFHLKQPERAAGMVYLPEQRSRMHEGDIREYRILAKEGDGWRTVLEGEAESGSYLQKFFFAEPVEADGFRLEVLSGYTRPGRMEWMEEKDGWHQRAASAGCRAEFSILSLIPVEKDGRNPAEGETFGRDEVPWKKAVRSKTKEIDD